MEEAKAAAYYDELTRKGEGAARFKQGLGFSSAAASNSDDVPVRGSALVSSSSSFLSSFVKASGPSKPSELDKQSQLQSIQDKLKAKKKTSPSRDVRASRGRSRSRSRERDKDRRSQRRSRSRERYTDGDRDRRRDKRRSRSRSDSDGDRLQGERRRNRSRSRSPSPKVRRAERRHRNRSRSPSPKVRRAERRHRNRSRSSSPARDKKHVKRNVGVDYSRLIQGYDKMTQAERVKAKMKLQLAETVEKDATKGSSGWERFEFNKDAPLDDEKIEAAGDDTTLVKHIGQSFRFSAVEAKREQKIRDDHDEAMFGVPVNMQPITTDDEAEPEPEADSDRKVSSESDVASSMLSEKVLAKQQGSWRDRARKQMS